MLTELVGRIVHFEAGWTGADGRKYEVLAYEDGMLKLQALRWWPFPRPKPFSFARETITYLREIE